MIIHDKLEQRTTEWLELKAGKISASKVATILTGKNLLAGATTYAIELIAESLMHSFPDFPGTFAMQEGIANEPGVRDKYAEDNNVEVVEVGGIEDGQLWFSPDGLVGDEGIIEIKSPQPKQHLINLLADTVPDMYLPQIQFGLLVSKRKWCDFISYNPFFKEGYDFKKIRVDRDWEYMDFIIKRIKLFNELMDDIKINSNLKFY